MRQRDRKEKIEATYSTATQLNPSPLTVGWKDVPLWQQDNNYILKGYRRANPSWKACLSSVFTYLHNETVNIHSHLEGALLFLYVLVTGYHPSDLAKYTSITWEDHAVMVVFLASAVGCMTGSAAFHTFLCHSNKVASFFHSIDYAGIVLLIVGSFFPSIYYGFYCYPSLQTLYLSVILIAGAGAAYIVLSPVYSQPSHRGARTTVFLALGLSSVIPIIHAILLHGLKEMDNLGLRWLSASGALYVSGALIYANRIPEALRPGRFDILGASHQIFHFNVVLAALAHYQGVLAAVAHTHGRPGGGFCVGQ